VGSEIPHVKLSGFEDLVSNWKLVYLNAYHGQMALMVAEHLDLKNPIFET